MTKVEFYLIGENSSLFDAMGGAILGSGVGALLGIAESAGSLQTAVMTWRAAGVLFLIFAGIVIVRVGRVIQRVAVDFEVLWEDALTEIKDPHDTSEGGIRAARLATWKRAWGKQARPFRMGELAAVALIILACICFTFAGLQSRMVVEAGGYDTRTIESLESVR